MKILHEVAGSSVIVKFLTRLGLLQTDELLL